MGNIQTTPPFGRPSSVNIAKFDQLSTGYPPQSFEVSVGAGIYAFNFGRTGTWSPQSFSFYTDQPVQVEVWDCYCVGDSLVLYDNGRKLQDSYGGQDDQECKRWSFDPAYCYTQAGWPNTHAYINQMLSVGWHNLTIATNNSPYSQGTAFLTVNQLCQSGRTLVKCCYFGGNDDGGFGNAIGRCNVRSILNIDGDESTSEDCHHHHHHHRQCHRGRQCPRRE